jgi:aminopeptidase S
VSPLRPFLCLLLLAACKRDDTDTDTDPEIGSLADAVPEDGYAGHLAEIEALSPESSGWRTAGGDGDAAARAYVTAELEALGWTVREDPVRWGIPLRSTANLVAELPGTDPEAGIVMLMAHGDSQAVGPGMNDNGSGVVALLTVAEAIDRWPGTLRAGVRLVVPAWEEGPAVGSWLYFSRLSEAERDQHLAFLNLDMLGSVNGGRFVLDPSVGSPDTPLGDGSAELTAAVAARWDEEGLPWAYGEEMGADHTWALDYDIPTTALYAGSMEVVTAEQAALFGTIEGQPMDPCYHAACDVSGNVDVELALTHVRAAAAAVEAIGGP